MTLEQLPSADGMVRWVGLLGPARQLAEVIAGTEFVPKPMRNKPDVVAAAIMYGDELDIGPMQALQGIDVIEGSPRPSAELMRALIFRAGHSLAVHEMTGQRCRVSGLRLGRPEAERVTVEWSYDMAKAAGLTGKTNWRSYPRAMLLARAMSDLARVLFPDVIKGMSYVAEDDSRLQALESWQPTAPEPQPQQPQRRAIQRRTPVAPPEGRHVADVPLPDTPPDRPGSSTGGAHRADGPAQTPRPPEADPPWDSRELVRPVDQPAAPDAPPEHPTPPEAPGDGSVPLVDGRQLTALHTLLTKILGPAVSAETRRMVMGDLVGRPLTSSRELTREEGDVMRVNLARVTSGTADLVFDEERGRWWVEKLQPSDPPAADEDVWRYDPETGELLDTDGNPT